MQKVSGSKFKIVDPLEKQQQADYERFLNDAHLDVAAVEWVEDAKHRKFVYDVNTNTNYNEQAEANAQFFCGLNEMFFSQHRNRTWGLNTNFIQC